MSGANIRRLRKERGWTLKQLAEHTSVTPQAIGQYERDERKPSFPQIVELSKALGVHPAVLFGTFEDVGIDGSNEIDDRGIFDELEEGLMSPLFAENSLNSFLGQDLGKIAFRFLSTWSKLNRSGRVKIMEIIDDIASIPRYNKEPMEEAHHGPEEEQ